jgi:SNF2 family DNA or RNA helicase
VALEIFDYQKVGAELLAQRPRYGLFDEMRVGKSAQAIRARSTVGPARGIVICPGTAREVWRGEFNKFGIIPRNLILKGVDIHDYVAWMRGRFDVLVTSYEQASRWADKIRSQGEVFDFGIVDEGHYAKNSEAQRTKEVLGDFTVPVGNAASRASSTSAGTRGS